MSKYKKYPRYKDSGVAWLGEIPESWGVKKLKYVLSLQTKKVEITTQEVIALENIESWSGRFIETNSEYKGEEVEFKTGDVLFGKLRPYLAKVFKCKSNGVAFGDLLTYKPLKNNSSTYAFYSLVSEPFINIVDSSTYGAKMPRASVDFINEMFLFIPKHKEQKSIANYLDKATTKIDTLIEKQTKLIELLKEKRQAVISKAVTRGLDASVPMKDSGVEWLGEIPEHWQQSSLKYISKITLGKMLTPQNKGNMVVRPYLKAKNIKWLNVDTDDVSTMWFSKNELKSLKLEKNDLLVSEGGEVGRTCIWKDELEECYIQNSVNRVKVLNNHPRFFLYQFYAAAHSGYFDSIVNKISIAHLTKEKLGDVSFSILSLQEQKSIANYLDKATTKIDTLIEKQTKLIELLKEKRTALISAAVTGKIDVRDAA